MVANRIGLNTELAQTMYELEAERDALSNDPSRLHVLFEEMLQMCLWCAQCLTVFRGLNSDELAQGKRNCALTRWRSMLKLANQFP